MKVFADTSALCALYREQENSAKAEAVIKRLAGPLCISTLVVLEFRQSARLQIYRFSKDRRQGFSAAEATRMLAKLESNMAAGALVTPPVEWPDVYSIAERLSERHTHAGGHRTLDVLHVATALHLGTKKFVTLDSNQSALARAVSLAVSP